MGRNGKKLNQSGSKRVQAGPAHTRSLGVETISQYTKSEIRPGFGHFPGGEHRLGLKPDPNMAHLTGRHLSGLIYPGSILTQGRFSDPVRDAPGQSERQVSAHGQVVRRSMSRRAWERECTGRSQKWVATLKSCKLDNQLCTIGESRRDSPLFATRVSRERPATLFAGTAPRLRRKSSPPPSHFYDFDPSFLLRGDEFSRSKTQIFRCANCDLTLPQFPCETEGLALLSRNSAPR